MVVAEFKLVRVLTKCETYGSEIAIFKPPAEQFMVKKASRSFINGKIPDFAVNICKVLGPFSSLESWRETPGRFFYHELNSSPAVATIANIELFKFISI